MSERNAKHKGNMTMNLTGKEQGANENNLLAWTDIEADYTAGLVADVRARAASLGLTDTGQRYLRAAAQAPSRRVRSTPKSSSGLYPSRKMGVSIAFESRTLELQAINALDLDEDVIAFFDQPEAVPVRYKRKGRNRAYHQTPDFLVVRYSRAVLVECKPLAKIHKRNGDDPGFYVQQGKNWVCPALQDAAALLGMQHEVWTEESFNLVRSENIRLLGDYMSLGHKIPGYAEALPSITSVLAVKGRANVEELLGNLSDKVCVDHVYAAIARGDVAFDWDSARLANHRGSFIYRDDGARVAFALSEASRVEGDRRVQSAQIQVESGGLISWDGNTWECKNIGPNKVYLSRGGNIEELPREFFDDLLKKGEMKPLADATSNREDPEVQKRIIGASQNDLRTANRRHNRVIQMMAHREPGTVSRTDRRYIASYKQAEAAYGNGYIGLLPGFSKSGRRGPRLIKEVLQIAVDIVHARYLTCTNIAKKPVYMLVRDACEAKNLPPPSYAWFCRFVDKLPAYETELARKGRKGAYPLEPPQDSPASVDSAEPVRAWERAHVDHTLIDVETIFGDTSERLGRCWVSVMIDHKSRRILAHYITYDPPSYRSVLMLMRKCVQRWGRLPESIVIDGGKEFQSVWCQATCALYKVTLIYRPVSKGRFGAQGERMFGTLNTNLAHVLAGNTTLRKNVRQMSEEVDPNKHAIWTLPELDKVLCDYFYEVYDTLEHRELLVTPRFAYEKSLEQHGTRSFRIVPYNELFMITTSPTTAKGEAKVQRDGLKIRYLYYYHSDLQRHLGKMLKVRYDPFDKSVAWAFADGRWLRLKSRHQDLLRNVTEHDLDLVTSEWRKRRSDVEKARLSEPVLIEFLKEIWKTEVLLLARKRAAEERRLRDAESDDTGEDEDDDLEEVPLTNPPTAPAPLPSTRAKRSSVSGKHAFDSISDDIEFLEAQQQ